MEMLTGYGSDASSDGERAASPPHAAAPAAAAPGHTEERRGLLSALPPPSTSGAAQLFAGVPAPKQRAKLPVSFRLPTRAPIDSDDEEERPKKKARPSSKGVRLTDFLPAPSNDAALALGSGKRVDVDSDEEFKDVAAPQPPAPWAGTDAAYDPAEGDAAGAAAAGPQAAAGGNEAYRVGPGGAPGAYAGPQHAPAGAQRGAAAPAPGPQWPAHGAGAYPAAGPSVPAGAAEVGVDGPRMLAVALAAEASSAAKRSKDPFADLGVKFVEVKQEKLRYIDPVAKEAMNATRTAFGADYEARLRAEAGAKPDKLSRRKHQISSLYHNAKMKELEMLDMRSQGMKTKAQTQAKYGW